MTRRILIVLAAFLLGCVVVLGLVLADKATTGVVTVHASMGEPPNPWVHQALPPDFGAWVDANTTTTVRKVRAVSAAKPRAVGTGRCGGDLPPCWVMQRESGGDIHAYNPGGCSGHGCYGKWQCDPTTCDGTGTEEEQDAEARRVWDNGRGCAHWNAC